MGNVLTWIEKVPAEVGAFISTEVKKIEGDVPVVEAALETAATIGDNLVNALKDWSVTPDGQAVEQVISNVPGIGPYVSDVLKFLPTLLVDLGHAKAEFTKSPAQIVQDGFAAAINAATPNIKASNLIVIAGHIVTEISALAGAPQSIQSAISAAPTVHAVINVVPVAKAA